MEKYARKLNLCVNMHAFGRIGILKRRWSGYTGCVILKSKIEQQRIWNGTLGRFHFSLQISRVKVITPLDIKDLPYFELNVHYLQ